MKPEFQVEEMKQIGFNQSVYDQLIAKYATKALEFPIIQGEAYSGTI